MLKGKGKDRLQARAGAFQCRRRAGSPMLVAAGAVSVCVWCHLSCHTQDQDLRRANAKQSLAGFQHLCSAYTRTRLPPCISIPALNASQEDSGEDLEAMAPPAAKPMEQGLVALHGAGTFPSIMPCSERDSSRSDPHPPAHQCHLLSLPRPSCWKTLSLHVTSAMILHSGKNRVKRNESKEVLF